MQTSDLLIAEPAAAEFVVHLVQADFVRAHGTGMPVVRGQSAADFQKDVLCGEGQAEAHGEQHQGAKEGTLLDQK